MDARSIIKSEKVREKYVEIDLLKYIPLDTYVTLDSEFKRKLFTKVIEKVGNQVKLAKIIETNPTSVLEWKVGRRSNRIPLDKILKCVKIANG